MLEIKTKQHVPFSPLLMEFTMPQEYIDALNQECEEIINDEERQKREETEEGEESEEE